MKTAIIQTKLKGYILTIDGKSKKKAGGMFKQMAEILELSAAGYNVINEKGENLNMC